MKKIFLPILSFIALTSPLLFAQEVADSSSDQVEEQDIRALREWIDLRRQVTVKKSGGNLSISGDVRTKFQVTSEEKGGIKQRGPVDSSAGLNNWDVEANLMLDYRTDRTWAAIKLEFDNKAGSGSGTTEKLTLERALLGGRILDRGKQVLTVNVGRQNLSDVFSSKIQFGSFMDGIVLRYEDEMGKIGDFYLQGGPFIVDAKRNHYAYAAELGLSKIGKTGLYTKFSLIDWDTKKWDTKKSEDHLKNLAYEFRNLQLTLGYESTLPWLSEKKMTLYGAFLCNTAARKHLETGNQKQPLAWYAGCSVGKINKKGDWALSLNYQWVQNQAVPDFDGSGIGRGNAKKIGLYSKESKGEGGAFDTPLQGVGKGNFKGFQIDLVYSLTENISISQTYRQSVNCSHLKYKEFSAPKFDYKQYKLELIYLF